MLDGIPFDTLAPSAIAGICVLLILTGWLVPRRTYTDVLKANKLKDAQIAEKDKQLALALDVGRTVTDVMQAIQRLARSGGSSHEEADR